MGMVVKGEITAGGFRRIVEGWERGREGESDKATDYCLFDAETRYGECELCGASRCVQVRRLVGNLADGTPTWIGLQMCFKCAAKRGAVPV